MLIGPLKALLILGLRGEPCTLRFLRRPKRTPEGHVVHYVTRSESKVDRVSVLDARFFNTLPQNMIPYHGRFLNALGYK